MLSASSGLVSAFQTYPGHPMASSLQRPEQVRHGDLSVAAAAQRHRPNKQHVEALELIERSDAWLGCGRWPFKRQGRAMPVRLHCVEGHRDRAFCPRDHSLNSQIGSDVQRFLGVGLT